jgi:hypothetical protein
MKTLKRFWPLWVVSLLQIISLTLDATGIIDWEWYYTYAPALFIGAAILITPYVVLIAHYYNLKNED